MNKFGKVLAVAVLTCTAVGLTACNEKKIRRKVGYTACSGNHSGADS